MSDASAYKVIKRPNRLARKVSRLKGVSESDLFARADTMLNEETADYQDRLLDDLDDLRAAYDEARGAGDGADKPLSGVFVVASDIRDQGSTCGFPMITKVTDMLCQFVDGIDRPSAPEYELIEIYIGTLQVVATERIHDENSETARTLLNHLTMAAAKVHKGP